MGMRPKEMGRKVPVSSVGPLVDGTSYPIIIKFMQ